MKPIDETSPEEIRIKQYILENPTLGKDKISNALGITHGIAAKRIRMYRGKIPVSGLRGIDASKFIDQYDLVKKTRDGLSLLNNIVVSDQDFRSHLGISSQDWARIKQVEEFEPYKKEIKGRTWWSTPAIFNKLQQKMDVL